MSDSIEDKLDELHRVFQNKLPEKISEMILLWKSIEETGKSEDISLFHRLAHSLHGSAATYGFEKNWEGGRRVRKCNQSFYTFSRIGCGA